MWVRLEQTATHTGEFRGLAPTGKKTKYSTVAIARARMNTRRLYSKTLLKEETNITRGINICD